MALANVSGSGNGGLAPTLTDASLVQAELQAIFEASYDELFITDAAGRVLRVSAAAERFYGVPAGDLVGRTVTDLEREGLFTPSATRRVIASRERQTVLQETKTGRRLVTTAVPVFCADGTLQRVVSISRDVTESKYAGDPAPRPQAEGPVWVSAQMEPVLAVVDRVAGLDVTVLLTGESGTGKGEIARLIHRSSPRAKGPLVTVDCGALPDSLIESELFGYDRGSFTGATKEGKEGLLESAAGGTLLLDEIGELPLPMQVKLLRFLQDGTVMRVGGRQAKRVDVRVIAATNRDLPAMVRESTFRADLYYRLAVVPLHLPPLRERREAIPVLFERFLALAASRFERSLTVGEGVAEALMAYGWPGNVRELEHLAIRLAAVAPGPEIRLCDLPAELAAADRPRLAVPPSSKSPPVAVTALLPLAAAYAEVERQLLTLAMAKSDSTREAATLLGVNQSTVVRKLQQHFGGRPPASDR